MLPFRYVCFIPKGALKGEVTTEIIGITVAERNRCRLEIITALIYSPNPERYASNVRLLENTNIQAVIDYFMTNWDPIKEQWVKCYKL